MTDALLSIRHAGPMVSLQDAGRPGHLRYGVTASGPMDRLAFAAAHAALGQPAGPAIEVSLGGLSFSTNAPVTIAITGGNFSVETGEGRTSSWQVLSLQAEETVTIRAAQSGSWAYVAFAGTLDVAPWLGSRATHAPSGLGGGVLHTGQTLRLKEAQTRPSRCGALLQPETDSRPVRVVIGPQEDRFEDAACNAILGQTFTVGAAYDRMGMRLEGALLPLKQALSIPSEPVLRGAIQVSGDGVPTVLLADHQPTGGYPKIANVLSCDTDRLAQCRSGDPVTFEAVAAHEGIALTRAHAARAAAYLEMIDTPRWTLEDRLMRENLIHGGPVDDLA